MQWVISPAIPVHPPVHKEARSHHISVRTLTNGNLANRDEELGNLATEASQGAQTYLTIASGKLDDPNRIHPFQNLVSLFASALGAAVVDPAAAIVTMDPGEWADALEMSLQVEKEMGVLRR